jgi:hypothetical protein
MQIMADKVLKIPGPDHPISIEQIHLVSWSKLAERSSPTPAMR